MEFNKAKLFRDLGIGVGLRPPHHQIFLNKPPRTVNWVEVISENFMAWRNDGYGSSFGTLEKVRASLPVALHGVSMNIGSADPLDLDYLKALKDLIEKIDPIVVSDHLSWTGVNGVNTHDLLPLPYTVETLNHIAGKIEQVQNFLGRRILIENPSSYLEFNNSEMTEWDFISELLNRSDCGLLLDINNVYVSSINHGFNPQDYLRKIPSQYVGQIHLAGHSNEGEYLIDTHGEPVCKEVWDLYHWYVNRFGRASTMIERDGNIPDWEVLESELILISEKLNNEAATFA